MNGTNINFTDIRTQSDPCESISGHTLFFGLYLLGPTTLGFVGLVFSCVLPEEGGSFVGGYPRGTRSGRAPRTPVDTGGQWGESPGLKSE